MALHPEFPRSPYEVLSPALRWFPAAEELRSTAYEKLLPPLVANVREEVKKWRDKEYGGASATSRALLAWWFNTDHLMEQADGTQSEFRYYFAQREAVETVIWLYDVRGARDKFDLLRFDASGAVSSNMFDEDWPRFVVKMATGAGKTKVLSLLMAWCYFHKLYEADSTLARNFLLIAPNIIVLDRLRADFDGLRIFFNDPVLPDNGYAGQNWRDDFQVALHIQDDVRIVRPTGNIFLTNIHRVYLGDVPEPSLDDDDMRDYFLAPFGAKPVGKTTDIHTTRKRLIGVQREKKAAEQDFRAFEVLNLGRYERQAYLNVGGRLTGTQKAQALAQKENEFRELILRAYKATGFGGNEGAQAQDGFFHGARNGRLVVIGPINLPVGRLFVEEVITECRKRGASRVDVLAFEFEMGLFPAALEEARGKGIDLVPKYIPAEVFDKRAVDKGQVVFHDISFVEATPRYD